MSLWIKVKDEFSRSPVATIGTVSSLLLALGTSLAGAFLAKSSLGQDKSPEAGIQYVSSVPAMASSLIIIALFLASTTASAGIARFFYNINKYIAVLFSIIIASITIFANRANAVMMGYGLSPAEKSQSIDDLLHYGTVLIFLALSGSKPLMDFARFGRDISKEPTAEEAGGTIGIIVILVLLWGWLVGWAERQMVQAFLM